MDRPHVTAESRLDLNTEVERILKSKSFRKAGKCRLVLKLIHEAGIEGLTLKVLKKKLQEKQDIGRTSKNPDKWNPASLVTETRNKLAYYYETESHAERQWRVEISPARKEGVYKLDLVPVPPPPPIDPDRRFWEGLASRSLILVLPSGDNWLIPRRNSDGKAINAAEKKGERWQTGVGDAIALSWIAGRLSRYGFPFDTQLAYKFELSQEHGRNVIYIGGELGNPRQYEIDYPSDLHKPWCTFSSNLTLESDGIHEEEACQWIECRDPKIGNEEVRWTMRFDEFTKEDYFDYAVFRRTMTADGACCFFFSGLGTLSTGHIAFRICSRAHEFRQLVTQKVWDDAAVPIEFVLRIRIRNGVPVNEAQIVFARESDQVVVEPDTDLN